MRIAMEKAGIIKPGAHLVLGPVDDRFVDGFRAEKPAAIWRWGEEISVTGDVATRRGRRFSLITPWQQFSDLELPLHGAHQATNCALAITAASAFVARALIPERVETGLAAVRMPGRLESVRVASGARPTVILDGAHNPDAARALATALAGLPRRGRRILVIGVLSGREPSSMLTAIDAASFDDIVTCTPPTGRARPAAEMADAARSLGWSATAIDDIGDALASTTAAAAADDQIIVTGSIYLVADARRWLLANAVERSVQ